MQQAQTQGFHLSLVATSRNDNHGGSLTQRMQHFVDGFVTQCVRHNLSAELILVEWNPPVDRPPLAEALKWPDQTGPCEIRIITVPREVHHQLEHADKLPLFQMIAKNVGIRRARGRFVLATNIDILFSDRSMKFMRDHLRAGRLYRTDRYDVPAELPEGVPFESLLRFCREESFRVHANDSYTYVREGKRWSAFTLLKVRLDPRLKYLLLWLPRRVLQADFWRRVYRELRHSVHNVRVDILDAREDHSQGKARRLVRRVVEGFRRQARRAWGGIRRRLVDRWPFTNACGDFTLLSREDWFGLRGYPEWRMYSFHLDSIVLYQAYHRGIREIHAGGRAAIYHIDHDAGSGYTPEASDKLFARLEARGIPCLDWQRDVVPMIEEMAQASRAGTPVYYNDEHWGFEDRFFSEQIVRPAAGAASG